MHCAPGACHESKYVEHLATLAAHVELLVVHARLYPAGLLCSDAARYIKHHEQPAAACGPQTPPDGKIHRHSN
jgi:hypothetical protein